jgi:hypothetical protein
MPGLFGDAAEYGRGLLAAYDKWPGLAGLLGMQPAAEQIAQAGQAAQGKPLNDRGAVQAFLDSPVAMMMSTDPIKSVRAAKAALPMDEASRMARARDMGFDTETPWFHGSERIDRVLETGKLDPRRATSGPMPYFTDSPELASNYAKNKPDTSRVAADDGKISNYFTVAPKDLGLGGRSPIDVERSWHFLSPEKKAEILEKARRVGYLDIDQATGPFTLHPSGVEASLSGDHFNWLMKTEARGNPLTALRAMWHDGGSLVGSESDLATIYKLAGYPHAISEYNAPWTQANGVLPAMLRMEKPLNTSNKAELEALIPKLRESLKYTRQTKEKYGVDMWDKNSRYSPREWVDALEDGLAKGENSYVWTSIPDKITEQLKRLGYDGILDVSGKGGGPNHSVAIPFSPNQVRSRFAVFDPTKKDSSNLLAGISALAAPVATAATGGLLGGGEY